MKRLLLLLALVCVSLSPAISQKYYSIGGQLGLQLPIGSFGDVAGTGFGFQAIGRMPYDKAIDLRATLGYLSWGAKEAVALQEFTYSDIPIMVGAEFKMGKNDWNPYVGGEIGLHMLSWNLKNSSISYSYSETDLGLGIFGGVRKNMGENMDFIADVKYNLILAGSNYSYLGVNAGVIFYLK